MTSATASELQTLIRDILKTSDGGTDVNGGAPVLMQLYRQGKKETIRKLLPLCPEAALMRDNMGFTILFQAVWHRDVEMVKAILAAAPKAAFGCDKEGQTPLDILILSQYKPETTMDFATDFTRNEPAPLPDLMKQSPANDPGKNREIVKLLLADPSAPGLCVSSNGDTPLHTLAYKTKHYGDDWVWKNDGSDTSIAEAILERAPKMVAVRVNNNFTPLHKAVVSHLYALFMLMADKNPEALLVCDSWGNTPIHYLRDSKALDWAQRKMEECRKKHPATGPSPKPNM